MQNEIITFNRKEADTIATEYFFNICGFNRDKEKHKLMMNNGLTVRDEMMNNLNVRAVISAFGKEAICGKTIDLNEIKFECNAFEHINNASVKKIYAYILTAGGGDIDSESIMDRLYADIWGTAYVDAARDLLQKEIKDRNLDLFVSESFGPGYYGMDVTQLNNFFKVLDGEKIGVQVKDSSLMVPVKSCAGFYIIVDNEGELPQSDCKDCLANSTGCQFCNKKKT